MLVLVTLAARGAAPEDSDLLRKSDQTNVLPGTPPEVAVLGFVDAPDGVDCDPVLARFGRCVEEVDFLDVTWLDRPVRDPYVARVLKNTADLYAGMWEDLVYRWDGDDVLDVTLLADGVSRLPVASEQWSATPTNGTRRVYAVPQPELWVAESSWKQRFPAIVTHGEMPRPALLRGRFAKRLGFDGKHHDFQVMDATREASGPFFEQMFPFVVDKGLLAEFEPGAVKLHPPRVTDAATLRAGAEQSFDRFYDILGVEIVRFAREEYTDSHTRVLGALMAMKAPPTAEQMRLGGVEGVNASGEGETDLRSAAVEPRDLGIDALFQLDYRALPQPIVTRHLDDWTGRADRASLLAVEDALFDNGWVRYNPRPLADLPQDESLSEALDAWSRDAALPGKSLDVVRDARWLLLRELVARTETAERDRRETDLLLDQVEQEVIGTFEGKLRTPTEVQDATTLAWTSTLGSHGHAAMPLGDLPGSVDPLAICTTKDRREALDEPVHRGITVDELVVADAGLQTVDAVIWQARDQMPFQHLDGAVDPEVTRLVGLPGDKAVYRLRWRVWTGWHLLWSERDGALAARTAAFCDDMVLAPRTLVPTLVRTAMLEGDLRATIPVKKKKKLTMPKVHVSSEVAGLAPVDEVRDTQTRAEAVDRDTAGIRDAARPMDPDDHHPPPIAPVASETVDWLRGLTLDALGDGMVVVFDHDRPGKRRGNGGLRPKTPYATVRRASVQSWGWAYHASDGQTSLVSPGWVATDSASSSELVTRWRRGSTSQWTLTGGLGGFPLRSVRQSCDTSGAVIDESSLAPCDPGVSEQVRTEGFSMDVSGLRTIWFLDRPRWAVEVGPELRLDTLHGGPSWLHDNPDDTRFGWAFRYQAGLLLGLRHVPIAAPLRSRAPWGAEAADGRSRLSRSEYGFRLGGLIGPTWSGLEATGAAEAWAGWSLRRKRSPASTFTPYRPNTLLGPFARVQAAKVVLPAEDRFVQLDGAWSLHLGVRGQLRAGKKPAL